MVAQPTSDLPHQLPELSHLCLAIVEHAPLPMAAVEGASHTVQYVNPAFCRLMDMPAEDLVGKPFAHMLSQTGECLTLLDRVYRSGESESHTRQQHSRPSPVFWSYTMWPVLGDKRPVGVMIQVTETTKVHEQTVAMNEALMLGSLQQHELTEAAENLTAQLQMEITELGRTAQERAEQKFRGLLEAAPDAIVFFNRKGRIVLVNAQTEKLFGYSASELLGQKIEVLLAQRFRAGHPGQSASFFGVQQPRDMDASLDLHGVHKDGTEFPVEISLNPLETDDGLLGMSTIRDITGRKRLERALYDKNVELQNAAQAKNLFLANMSHELRTPLNGIIGFSEFLTDGKPGPINPKQHEYLNDILTSGHHLLHLINDILDLAKVEAGKMEMKPSRFSLREVVAEVCAVAGPTAQKKHICINCEIAPTLGDIILDKQKFKQVLDNLLSNALKFSDDGGTVNISATPLDTDRFKLMVRDAGIGISAEDLHRLFREFEQLESGASRHYEGTGLGLALTRKIVELQGGRIDVESDVNSGSTFTVNLPLAAK